MQKIPDKIAEYYDQKIREHGAAPMGVDWKNSDSQNTRLLQLIKFIDEKERFSILDVGCGYGKLLELMQANFVNFNYTGVDYSREQIEIAKQLNAKKPNVDFKTELDEEDKHYDYVVASGIFNVMFADPFVWTTYVRNEMHKLFDLSKKMFACNFLTDYSDAHRKSPDLFYAKPEEMFKFAATELYQKLIILHDYEMFDFTLLVKK